MSYLFIQFLVSFASCAPQYECPISQKTDTHSICRIFQSTNIYLKIPHDFSDDNYCEWGYIESKIGCQSVSTEEIDVIIIEYADGINGSLNLEYSWPSHLKELDLEQSSSSSNLYGEWHWQSIETLESLTELDLDGNEFSGNISNVEWNIIAAMPSLIDFTIVDNNFKTNFSEIRIESISGIKIMGLSENDLYGIMDLSQYGFLSKFPELEFFWMDSNHVYGHFENLDMISSKYLPNLKELKIGNNHYSGQITLSLNLSLSPSLSHFEIYKNQFSGLVQWDIFSNLHNLKVIDIGGNSLHGSLAMSQDLTLPSSLRHIDVDYNNFHGQIDWNIFADLYDLIELHLNDNSFSGAINWNIISELHNNGQLNNMNFRDNDFIGYADFSWIDDDKLVYLDLDMDIPCDPIIYPCANGIQTKRKKQGCSTKYECESTCVCSFGDNIEIIITPSPKQPLTVTVSNTLTPNAPTTAFIVSELQTSVTANASLIYAESNEYFAEGVYVNHNYVILIGCIVFFGFICSFIMFAVYWKAKQTQNMPHSPVHQPLPSNIVTPAQKRLSVACTEFSIRPKLRKHANTITNPMSMREPGYADHILGLSGKTRRKTTGTYEGPEGQAETDCSDSCEFTIEEYSSSFNMFGNTPHQELAYSLNMGVMRGRILSNVNMNDSAKQGSETHEIKHVKQSMNSVALAVVAMMRMLNTESMNHEY